MYNKRRLAMPYLLWVILFAIIPLFLMLYFAVTNSADGFTAQNFINIFDPSKTTMKVLVKSVSVAFISTVICLALGYPIALIMASKEYSKRTIMLFLFVVPMWMNSLLRTYAWLTLLETNGAINTLLSWVQGGLNGVLGTSFKWKLDILYTDGAVFVGMVYNFIPFMIMPIYTVLTKMDSSIVEAAQDLGANPLMVFRKIILPISLPGVISGVTMVFMPAVTTFVIPNLLGGGQYMLIGNQLEKQFITLDDWHFGSALSLVLMTILLISMTIISIVDRNKESEAA